MNPISLKSTSATSFLSAISAVLMAVSGLAMSSNAAIAETQYGISMNGRPELPNDFTYFPYVNPDAPQGGEITYCVIGTFDNFNPFILKSMRTTARGVIDTIFGNLVFEPLMRRSQGEAFSLYGLLAERVEMDEDRSYAEFHLNPDAKWSDGRPVTPEDIIFTYEAFTTKGRPPYSTRMDRIKKIEKTGDHSVKFSFNDKADREFPLVIALTPIVPAHAFNLETFDRTTLKPVIASGPYIIEQVNPGQRIVFKRNPDYWGKNVPSMRGFHNYERIKIDYFLNANSLFEAFKKGLCSVQIDLDPLKISRDFDFPAVERGDVIVESFESLIPPAVTGFFFNIRRQKFSDARVRRALSMFYDFDWVNKNIFNGDYQRTLSYWQGSELSALGTKANKQELEFLAPYLDRVLPEVLDGTYGTEALKGGEISRQTMRDALELLQQAGYHMEKNKLVGPDNQPFEFEVLISGADQERIATSLQRTLARIGITVTLRTLDDAQIQQRKQVFDFDVIIAGVGFVGTLSPGIEQIGRWGSESANAEGSFNLAGVADPAIDAMIERLLNARDETTFISSVRALDRLLMSGAYLIPTQHNSKQWVAYWNYLEHPKLAPLNGYDLSTWWRKPQ